MRVYHRYQIKIKYTFCQPKRNIYKGVVFGLYLNRIQIVFKSYLIKKMAETSNQNNNPIDLREVVKIFSARFDQIDGRFTKVDDRFDQIDGRFANVDDRFDQIDGRFTKVDDRFDQIDGRFAKVDDRFDQMDQNYRELVEFLAGEFDKIHQTKADKVDMEENFNLVLNRVAMINTKIDDYRAEQIGLKRQVDKHEKWHFAVANKVGVKLLSK